tara:strand:- start:396 stop:1433 length:1038 start_codon:yes stop_codon:yes gene_type:complete
MSEDNVDKNATTTEAGSLTLDDAATAILKDWEDQAEPASEDETEATEETTSETEVEDSDTESEEEAIEEEEIEEDLEEEEEVEDEEETEEVEEEAVELTDDTLVDIQVDGQTKQASIRDLKRLYGQEASLTRKSQETAQSRKEAQEQLQKADASLQAMISRAQERYKPYQDVDMLVASKTMSNEDFAALRAEAKVAEDDLKFLTEEANGFYGYLKSEQEKRTKQQASEAVKVLQKEIPSWNNALYNDIRGYAISNGLPEDTVNSIVDPNVIMLLHKAKLYDETKKVATVKKTKATKKKVLRTKKAPMTKANLEQRKKQEYRDRLRETGSDLEAMADVIMSNWEGA